MQGAKTLSRLFKTGQYGRLYITSGSHARGRTFRIFVLPENVTAESNGENNPPINCDAVEVYGVISGNPGWTECYGWLHNGKWKDDFLSMVEEKERENKEGSERRALWVKDEDDKLKSKTKSLLDNY